ncbi:MAG: RsmB/NOP family class I SAM-dependent RNA methyltransferase [Polyangiaceae bacterium]|nr:RsmB/NOP family class I SAM-dependent RNA methyltransferase [Polyangiaceae bacterium]
MPRAAGAPGSRQNGATRVVTPAPVVACTEAEARRVRPLVIAAYAEARARNWPFLSDVLSRVLRGLSDDDVAVAAAAVQALVKYDRLLGFATGNDAADDRFDALFAVHAGGTRAEDLAARLEAIGSLEQRIATAYSVPDWIVSHLGRELGAGAIEPALARMNAVPPRVVRVNTLRTTRDDAMRALAAEGLAPHPTAHASAGLVLGGRRSPFRTAAFARGDFELQDEASQLVAELVAPPPRARVIDACAGAGGKTLALAAALANKGSVIAFDASDDKLRELRRRARRAGADNVRAFAVDLLDPEALAARAREAGGPAARVLLDAPCSGLGAIRRNPEARWRLQPEDLDRLVDAQNRLAAAAASLVAPHGRLVYATCSFLPSEGEAAVARFLREHPGFIAVTARDVLGRARSEPVASPGGAHLETWRFDPPSEGGDAGMDGFFAAVVRRVAPRVVAPS